MGLGEDIPVWMVGQNGFLNKKKRFDQWRFVGHLLALSLEKSSHLVFLNHHHDF